MRYPLVIFDLDGTLSDSTGCVVAALQASLEAHGLRAADGDLVRSLVGLPLRTLVQRSCPDGLAERDVDAVELTYRALYPGIASREERMFAGMPELLDQLCDAGVTLALATGKSQRGAVESIRRLGLRPYFRAVHGIVPGTPGKPHPALLDRVFKDVRFAPDQAVMVGDTSYDLVMAKRFGAPSCAVGWGAHSLGHLRGCTPDHVAETVPDLASLLLDADA